MLKISVKADLSKLIRKFQVVESQAKFATALALTRTAQGVAADLAADLPRIFKSVAPFTKRAFYISKATKSNLTATVGIKQKQAQYLYREIVGGARDPAIEKLLGRILPSGYFVVPTSFSKLTANRKVSIAWVRKIADQLAGTATAQAKVRKKRGAANVPFIVAGDAKLHPGIYQKVNAQGIAPLLLFVKRPKYSRRYDFKGTAKRFARARFADEFARAARDAMATAR